MGQMVTLTISRRYDLPVQGPGDEPKYKVELLPAEGAVQVSDGTGSVLVSLTSAVMREPAGQCPRTPPPHHPIARRAIFDCANFTPPFTIILCSLLYLISEDSHRPTVPSRWKLAVEIVPKPPEDEL